ncbi:MAG TPA: hypothetical protein VIB39_03755 [Candidatus Angelobacter sp.]|jgi:hypothetical protein
MPQRGSEKLKLSAESLKKTLAAAKIDLTIEWWWKYGQPQIDRVAGLINVSNPGNAGRVVQELLGAMSREVRGTLEVFPYGIVNPEGARIAFNYDIEVD